MTRKQTSCLYFQPEYRIQLCAGCVFTICGKQRPFPRKQQPSCPQRLAAAWADWNKPAARCAVQPWRWRCAVSPGGPERQRKPNRRTTAKPCSKWAETFEAESSVPMQCCELKAMRRKTGRSTATRAGPVPNMYHFCAEYAWNAALNLRERFHVLPKKQPSKIKNSRRRKIGLGFYTLGEEIANSITHGLGALLGTRGHGGAHRVCRPYTRARWKIVSVCIYSFTQ